MDSKQRFDYCTMHLCNSAQNVFNCVRIYRNYNWRKQWNTLNSSYQLLWDIIIQLGQKRQQHFWCRKHFVVWNLGKIFLRTLLFINRFPVSLSFIDSVYRQRLIPTCKPSPDSMQESILFTKIMLTEGDRQHMCIFEQLTDEATTCWTEKTQCFSRKWFIP